MAEEKKSGFFKKLLGGLSKTRDNVIANMESLFMGVSTIDEDFYEELEEILVMGDLGIGVTEEVIERLREEVTGRGLMHPDDCREAMKDILKELMKMPEGAYDFEDSKSVVFMIGVNGVGKTTSVGKLASQYKKQGKKVLLAAADTFRAAAIEQLTAWAERADVPIIAQKEGGDPAAVVFDAVTAAKSRGTDILLCDTAGRLHNKKNLMDELRKMSKIISSVYPEAKRENLLVLDATTGQNAISQAKEFMSVTDITGIILTKMDGTAKGGMAIGIQKELKIPVKFIGIGEGIDDLEKFDPEDFVDALFES